MTHEQLQALLKQADKANNTGNYDEAERLASEVLTAVSNPTQTLPRREGLSKSDTDSDTFPTGEGGDGVTDNNNMAKLHISALIALSTTAGRKADFKSALSIAQNALDFAILHGFVPLQTKALNNIGLVHTNLSNYTLALEYFAKALTLNEELGNKVEVARNLGNMGNVSRVKSDYTLALEYLNKALALNEEIGNKRGVASTLGNIGLVHKERSDYTLALEHYGKALTLEEQLGNKANVALWLGNIGNVHSDLSDYPKALEYFGKALSIDEELGNKAGVAAWLGNIGLVHHNLSDYPKALEYYGKALSIAEELGYKAGVARHLGNIGGVHGNLSEYPKALEYFGMALSLSEELGNKRGVATWLGNIGETYARVEFEGFDAVKAEEFLLKAVTISTEIGHKQHLVDLYKTLSDLYEHEKRDAEALVHFKKHIAIKNEVNIEEVKKQESIREQQKAIEIERTRATAEKNILNNILPEEITTRLIKGENPIADSFDCVSILFMDIVDFTRISTTITAQQLVHLLNAIFTAADGVMREFGLEKIKTIGDAYMAVAGAPIVQEDHAHRAAHAALKLLDVMQNLVVTFPEKLGDKKWIDALPEIHVRIGVHCGPAAAGVVGENKFLYDLWGDAVNTAARMESHGEAGKIHCSEEFKNALTETHGRASQLNNIQFISRGEMEIKGKGKMKTFFLERA